MNTIVFVVFQVNTNVYDSSFVVFQVNTNVFQGAMASHLSATRQEMDRIPTKRERDSPPGNIYL